MKSGGCFRGEDKAESSKKWLSLLSLLSLWESLFLARNKERGYEPIITMMSDQIKVNY